MNSSQIFVGNIKKCTKYEVHSTFSSETFIGDTCIGSDSFEYIEEESEIEKEQAVLIKVRNGAYVDLDSYRTALDYFKVRQSLTENGFRLNGLIMSTSPHCKGSLFVDSDTLRPYYTGEKKNVSVRKLKKELKRN